jgi:hypothetical protein
MISQLSRSSHCCCAAAFSPPRCHASPHASLASPPPQLTLKAYPRTQAPPVGTHDDETHTCIAHTNAPDKSSQVDRGPAGREGGHHRPDLTFVLESLIHETWAYVGDVGLKWAHVHGISTRERWRERWRQRRSRKIRARTTARV